MEVKKIEDRNGKNGKKRNIGGENKEKVERDG